jgi:hypothetical protein
MEDEQHDDCKGSLGSVNGADDDDESSDESVCESRQTRGRVPRNKKGIAVLPISIGGLGQDGGGHDSCQGAGSGSRKKRNSLDRNAEKIPPRAARTRRSPRSSCSNGRGESVDEWHQLAHRNNGSTIVPRRIGSLRRQEAGSGSRKKRNSLDRNAEKILRECNQNLRKYHDAAMREERGHIGRETKRRKLAEDRLDKVKQLIDSF